MDDFKLHRHFGGGVWRRRGIARDDKFLPTSIGADFLFCLRLRCVAGIFQRAKSNRHYEFFIQTSLPRH